MKKQAFLIFFICTLALNLSSQFIPDDNFRMKINEHLGQPANYEPTIADLNGITGTLYALAADIATIEGAQYLSW